MTGVHRKANKKTRQKYFHKIHFRKKIIAKIVSMGVQRKVNHKKNSDIKKNFYQKRFHKKSPKDRINGVHRKATKKTRKKISLINHFQKELSQRSYQWGTQES